MASIVIKNKQSNRVILANLFYKGQISIQVSGPTLSVSISQQLGQEHNYG